MASFLRDTAQKDWFGTTFARFNKRSRLESQRTRVRRATIRQASLDSRDTDSTRSGHKSEDGLIDEILDKIDQTGDYLGVPKSFESDLTSQPCKSFVDGGSALSNKQQSSVNDLIISLEEAGRAQQPRPLKNPDIFGNYNVAFSSTQRAPKQEGQPAGGGFRSGFGRRVFQTTRLCQSIIAPTLVTNKVEFLLLGIIKGSVGLRGFFKEVEGDGDTVKVLFQPPRVTLGKDINLPIGPKSSVVLTTTYLTPTFRLGKGSRGSLFVFTKGGPADNADMEKVGLGRSTPAGWIFLLATLFALWKASQRLWISAIWGRLFAAVPAGFMLLILLALGRDIVKSPNDPAAVPS